MHEQFSIWRQNQRKKKGNFFFFYINQLCRPIRSEFKWKIDQTIAEKNWDFSNFGTFRVNRKKFSLIVFQLGNRFKRHYAGNFVCSSRVIYSLTVFMDFCSNCYSITFCVHIPSSIILGEQKYGTEIWNKIMAS